LLSRGIAETGTFVSWMCLDERFAHVGIKVVGARPDYAAIPFLCQCGVHIFRHAAGFSWISFSGLKRSSNVDHGVDNPVHAVADSACGIRRNSLIAVAERDKRISGLPPLNLPRLPIADLTRYCRRQPGLCCRRRIAAERHRGLLASGLL